VGESGSYLYAVGRDVDPSGIAAVRGLRGGELRLVGERGLVAIASTVDLDEFGEDALHKNFEDLQWLEDVARGHDQVINELAAIATIAPCRLATICRTDDAIRHRLDRWHDDLFAALDRIEGRNEWSVKIYEAPRPIADEGNEDLEPGSPGSGAAYLQRRRSELSRARQSAEAAAALADELYHVLAAGSVASRRLPIQDRRLSGRDDTMSLNGTYLIDGSRTDEFQALVAELADRYPELRFELQGPWPPYSFASLEAP
jgi:hypothetical protein